MARELIRSMAPYPCEKEFLEKVLAVLPNPPEYPAVTLSPASVSFTHLCPCRPPCLLLSTPGSQDSGLYPLLEHSPPGESTANSLFQVSTPMAPVSWGQPLPYYLKQQHPPHTFHVSDSVLMILNWYFSIASTLFH